MGVSFPVQATKRHERAGFRPVGMPVLSIFSCMERL